jgi:CheY-like chemotaxis protein
MYEELKMKTILIVDDACEIRSFIKKILQNKGYETLEASDADEAIRVDRKDNPEVVLMDYNMPGELHGLDAVSAIRNNHSNSTKNIIVMSASAEDGLETKALDSGANSFIRKPFSISTLFQKLEMLAA